MTTYAIIEDNPFALANLSQTVARIRPDWELLFASNSVGETLKRLEEKGVPSIFFMDIELADGKSFSIFNERNINVPVIFITAFDNFAIQAFNVNVVDYILKPFSMADLEKSVVRFENIWLGAGHKGQPDEASSRPVSDETEGKSAKRLLTVSGEKFNYINISDVSYFISEDNYVFAYLKQSSDRKMINLKNLTELQETINSDDFFRISRSVLASIGSIKSVSKYLRGRLKITLSNGLEQVEATLSADRREQFLNWLGR